MTKRNTVVNGAIQSLHALIEKSYAVGAQLPNEKQLAEELGVSRGTVREALGVLASEGAVTRSWGVGTFVSPPRPVASLNMSAIQSYRDRVQSGGSTVTLPSAHCELEVPPEAVLAALHLAAETPTWKVSRLFAVDGVPSAHMVEYVPAQLMGVAIDPHAMLVIDTDLFDMLNRHLAGCVAKTVTDLAATLVDEEHALLLGVNVGEPVLKTEQVTLNAHDEPLAYGTTLQRTDLVRMRITR